MKDLSAGGVGKGGGERGQEEDVLHRQNGSLFITEMEEGVEAVRPQVRMGGDV